MKKKTIFTALATTLSVAILSGSLVVPTFATPLTDTFKDTYAPYVEFKGYYPRCKFCNELIDNRYEDIMHHLRDCSENKGECKYCGKWMEGGFLKGLSSHELNCNKNPNKKSAVSSAKEEIEIIIDLPEIETFKCDKCGKEFSTEDELKAHKSSAKEEIEIEIPLPDEIETFTCDRCGKEFNTEEELKEHKAHAKEEIEIEIPLPTNDNGNIVPLADSSAKEEIEIEIPLPEVPETPKTPNTSAKEEIEVEIEIGNDDIDDFFKCFRCGEVAIGYHKCPVKAGNPSAKEEIEIEIEIPTNDNAEQIAILEAEVVEAERIANEARAEADRLTTIASEKRAELEALRQ